MILRSSGSTTKTRLSDRALSSKSPCFEVIVKIGACGGKRIDIVDGHESGDFKIGRYRGKRVSDLIAGAECHVKNAPARQGRILRPKDKDGEVFPDRRGKGLAAREILDFVGGAEDLLDVLPCHAVAGLAETSVASDGKLAMDTATLPNWPNL